MDGYDFSGFEADIYDRSLEEDFPAPEYHRRVGYVTEDKAAKHLQQELSGIERFFDADKASNPDAGEPAITLTNLEARDGSVVTFYNAFDSFGDALRGTDVIDGSRSGLSVMEVDSIRQNRIGALYFDCRTVDGRRATIDVRQASTQAVAALKALRRGATCEVHMRCGDDVIRDTYCPGDEPRLLESIWRYDGMSDGRTFTPRYLERAGGLVTVGVAQARYAMTLRMRSVEEARKATGPSMRL